MSKETRIHHIVHQICTFNIQPISQENSLIPNTKGLRIGKSEITFKKNAAKEMVSIRAFGPDIIRTIYQQ
jgi:hypothetical protein